MIFVSEKPSCMPERLVLFIIHRQEESKGKRLGSHSCQENHRQRLDFVASNGYDEFQPLRVLTWIL